MNERVKELAEQAGLTALLGHNWLYGEELTRFAELVRLDETKACAKHYLEIMRDAVEQAVLKERESNAKLAEITCCKCMDTAEAIRQRSENEPS